MYTFGNVISKLNEYKKTIDTQRKARVNIRIEKCLLLGIIKKKCLFKLPWVTIFTLAKSLEKSIKICTANKVSVKPMHRYCIISTQIAKNFLKIASYDVIVLTQTYMCKDLVIRSEEFIPRL